MVFLNEVGKDADGSFRIVDGTCFNDFKVEILSAKKRPAKKLRQLYALRWLLLRATPRDQKIRFR